MSVLSELQNIYDAHGQLTPEIVVAEASNAEHPLHRRFDWDDNQAAVRWRLHQASALIRSVNVVVQRTEDAPPIRVRAFVSEREMGIGLDQDAPDEGAYIPVEQVVSNDVLRSAWFQSLRRDWERLKAKAGASQEFAQMVVDDMRAMAS